MLLLDAATTGPDVFEVLARIRTQVPSVRTVLLAPSDGPELALRALGFGAVGHIDAGADAEAFRAAVRTVARGERTLSPVLQDALVGRVEGGDQMAETTGVRLSAREFQVLRLLAGGTGTTEIAAELAISASTVRSYKATLRGKLGLGNDAALVRYAIDHGLV